MASKLNGFCSTVMLVALAVGLAAQGPQPAQPSANPQSPTFKVQIDAVTLDVVVKDDQGRFVPIFGKTSSRSTKTGSSRRSRR